MLLNPYRFSVGSSGGTVAPTFVSVAAALSYSTSTSVSIAVAPTYAAGDILMLFVQTSNGITVSTPAGWTLLTPTISYGTSGAGSTKLTIFWKLSGSSESAVTVTASGADHLNGVMACFRGQAATPFGNYVSGAFAGTGNVSAITTTIDKSLVLIIMTNTRDFMSDNYSGWTNANLTGLTERFDASDPSGNGGGIAFVTGVKDTAGTTGTTAVTNSQYNAFLVIELLSGV